MSLEAEELEEERHRKTPPKVVIEIGGSRTVHYLGTGQSLTLCHLEKGTPRKDWDICHGTDDSLSCNVCQEIHKKKPAKDTPTIPDPSDHE